MANKFCYNCGSELEEGNVYCGNCGAKQEIVEETKVPIQEPEPQTFENNVEVQEPEPQTFENNVEVQESEPKRTSINSKTKIIIAGIACAVVAIVIVIMCLVSCQSNITLDGKFELIDGGGSFTFHDSDKTFDFHGDEQGDDKGTFKVDQDKNEVICKFDSDGTKTTYKTDGEYFYFDDYSGDAEPKVTNQRVSYFDTAEGTPYRTTISIEIIFNADGTYSREWESHCEMDSRLNSETMKHGTYTVDDSTGLVSMTDEEGEKTHGIIRDGAYYDQVYEKE